MALVAGKARECEEYPLTARTRSFRNFYSNYQFFWHHLIKESGDELYDGTFLPFITSWLSSLSFSKLRPIRHTATAGILSLSQALVDALLRESTDLERILTFIETEASAGHSTRLEHLTEQKAELTEKVSALEKVLDEIYQDVLQYRQKDIMTEIRAICVQSLGYWAEKCPAKYLNTDTKATCKWMLFDKSSEVREHVLSFLTKVLTERNKPQLEDFVQQNRLRLLEMCHDIENKCCVLAIQVNSRIARLGLLSEEAKSVISCLIWAEAEEIRNAASEFVDFAVFEESLPKDASLTSGFGIEQGRYYKAEAALLKLIDFYNEHGAGALYRVELLVKAFWHRTNAVRSWEAICQLLRRGDSSRRTIQPLQQSETIPLIHILVSSMKIVTESPEKRQKNPAIQLSSTLIGHLPNLLEFYKTEPQPLLELTRVFVHLELAALAAKDLKQPFGLLLSTMRSLHLASPNAEVLKNTAAALARSSKEAHPLQKEAKVEFRKLVDECILLLKEDLKVYILEGVTGLLRPRLLRIESLIMVSDLTEDLGVEVFQDLVYIISQFLTDALSEHAIALRACSILFYWHLWALNGFSKSPDDLRDYIHKRDSAIEHFSSIVAKQDAEEGLRQETFKFLCETLMVVAGQAAAGSPVYYQVDPEVVATLEDYMIAAPLLPQDKQPAAVTKTLFKKGARSEALKAEADERSQLICLLVARVICNCPSVTNSRLPSSFMAHYGYSPLRTVSIIVKQVLGNFKTKDSQQTGAFEDQNLFFNVITESLIKSMGFGEELEVLQMKRISKQFAGVLGPGPLRPKQADRLVGFLLESVSFCFGDKENFQFMEGLVAFVNKNYLSPAQSSELFERILKDAEQVEDMLRQHKQDHEQLMLPIKRFLQTLNRASRRSEFRLEAPGEPQKRRTRSPAPEDAESSQARTKRTRHQ